MSHRPWTLMYSVTPNPPPHLQRTHCCRHNPVAFRFLGHLRPFADIYHGHCTVTHILAAHPGVLFGFIHFYFITRAFPGLRKITIKQSRCSRSTVLILIPVTCLLRDFGSSCGFAHDDAVDAEYRYGCFCCELDRPLFCG